jgi:ribosomal protein S18 acetylase RimI-like enzyme
MKFEFRKAILPQELPNILAFDAKVFTLPGDIWEPADWSDFKVYWLIANGTRVGCCAIQHNVDFDGDPKTGSLLIASIGVLPERRHEGLGARFTEWQIDYARKLGFSAIVATTRESNAAMIGLYKKLGFEIRCITEYYENPDERAVVFDLQFSALRI